MRNTPDLIIPRSPFAALPVPHTVGEAVVVRDRDGLGVASVFARRGQRDALTAYVRETWGIELPLGPERRGAGDLAFLGTGPGRWLAIQEAGGNAFVTSLAAAVGSWASISDQSDAHAVLRVSGPRARDTLCKLIPVDLHPRAFQIDQVASTVAHHMAVTIWRLPDDASGGAVFELAVFRSFAASFWHAFAASAAEFGLRADWTGRAA